MTDEALLLFVRFPEPGRAKTRLIPALGAEGAAALYRRMATEVAAEAGRLVRTGLGHVALVEPPERVAAAGRWLGSPWQTRAQAAGDLGARLAAAFDDAFAAGAERVVAIGTDCLDLDADLLGLALDRLADHDAVVGPATDGGYYLLGLSRPVASCFEQIPWSTSETLRVTRARLAAAGCTVAELLELRDLDTPDDLAALAPQWGRRLGIQRKGAKRQRRKEGGQGRGEVSSAAGTEPPVGLEGLSPLW